MTGAMRQHQRSRLSSSKQLSNGRRRPQPDVRASSQPACSCKQLLPLANCVRHPLCCKTRPQYRPLCKCPCSPAVAKLRLLSDNWAASPPLHAATLGPIPYDTAAVPELKPGISYRYLPDGSSPKPLGSANTFSSSCPFACERSHASVR